MGQVEMNTMSSDKQYLIAIDAGGTMTDAFLVDNEGNFHLGKALTNHDNESDSYLASVKDAGYSADADSSTVHRNAIASIYTGTAMLNTLVQNNGSKVGLLITRGFEHFPYIERALTWLQQSPTEMSKYQMHEHNSPMVELKNVKPVSERIVGGSIFAGCHLSPGKPVIPLAENEVRKAVEELLDAGVTSIGILFLHSYLNPQHEHRAAEIANDVISGRGVTARVVTSSDICPRMKESTRLKSLLVECFAAEKTRQQLLQVEDKAKNDGYQYNLKTVLAYGSVADVRYPRLYESVCSGPTGGVMGAQYLARHLNIGNVICADLGGTSFDSCIIVDGVLPITKEPDFARHRLNLPMVGLDTIGAGTGMEIHVDPEMKRTTLGPESAGSRVGVCFGHHEITVSDVNLVLGYLSPDNFLGGKVKLDVNAARKALEERLAKPLGMGVEEAGSAVLDYLASLMRDHLNEAMLSRGLNPREFTMLAYGGSGPLHMWDLVSRMKIGAVCTVPWAAAFSAFGVAVSEYFHRYEKNIICPLPNQISPQSKFEQARVVDAAWREMEQRAYQELTDAGFAKRDISFRYGISARYLGQLFASWDAPVAKGTVDSVESVDELIASFEKVYGAIYPNAARFPEAGYLISGAYVEAVVPKIRPKLAEYPLKEKTPSRQAHKGRRDVYHRGDWRKFDIWDMDGLAAGNVVEGPAIIEHSMTTMVIPPENYVEFDKYRVIWYREKAAAAAAAA